MKTKEQSKKQKQFVELQIKCALCTKDLDFAYMTQEGVILECGTCEDCGIVAIQKEHKLH
jgi:hypothetical protein